MANNFGTNVWRIDTPSANPVMQTAGFAGRACLVSQLEFSGYAAPTDECVFTCTDAQGNTFVVATFQGKPDLSPVSSNFGKPVWMRGLAVSVLTSGIAGIYQA